MDSITLIVSALIVGSAEASKETAKTSIKYGYQGLVSLIKQKAMNNPKALTVIDEHAADPRTWQKPLEKLIQEIGVAEDKEILVAAQNLVELIQSQKSPSTYNVEIHGDVQGMAQGDNANVVMNLPGDPTTDAPAPMPKKKRKRK